MAEGRGENSVEKEKENLTGKSGKETMGKWEGVGKLC